MRSPGSALIPGRCKFSVLPGAVAAGVATVVLTGWTFNIPSLMNLAAGAVPMHPITAVLFGAAGVAMMIKAKSNSTVARRTGLAFAGLIGLAGFIRLCLYVAGIQGVDSGILFPQTLRHVSLQIAPVRIQIAPNTALSFMFLGIVLLIVISRTHRFMLTRLLLVFGIALLAVLTIGGHFIRVTTLGAMIYEVPMSLSTAIVFLTLAAGLLASMSDGLSVSSRGSGARSLDGRIAIGFAAAVFMLCAIGIISCKSISQLISDARWSNHTYQTIAEISLLHSRVKEAESSTRGYVISGEPQYLDAFQTAVDAIPLSIQALRTATRDNAAEQSWLDQLEPLLTQKLQIVHRQVQLRGTYPSELPEQSALAIEGTRVMDQMAPIFRQLEEEENGLLVVRLASTEASAWRSIALIVSGSATALVLVALAGWLIHRDIAGRTRAERALQAKSQQLETAYKELESFSYSVSHDLRTPLRSLDGFSQALLEDYADKLDDEGRNYLQRIRAASQRMGQLIDDLLNLAKVTRATMAREKVDLSKMAREVLETLHNADPKRDVEFVVADGLLDEADSHLLRVVMSNLLGNAWKFTANSSHARIEFGRSGTNGDASYFVRDNGAGFDMKYAGKLFGAFQRLHAAKDFPGTGIGLATVQRIVQRHSGRIWATGQVNEGATFHFTL